MGIMTGDWTTFLANHLDYNTIGTVVSIPAAYKETCCIQLSHALHAIGVPIGPGPHVGLVHANKNYIIRVSTLRAFLNQSYEEDNYQGTVDEMKAELAERRGIIMFGDRHVDVWTGANIHRPSQYNLSALWDAESTQRLGIFFWDVEEP